MRNRFSFAALAFGLSFPLLASAQSGTVTGSGGLSASGSSVWEERQLRTEGFWQAALAFRKVEEAFHKQESLRRQKLYAHRKECTEEIRRANRDTRFRTMLTCYRTDALSLQEIVREQKEYLLEIPGVTEAVRSNALTTADNLTDAIATIVEAIDAGVYYTEADLLEAKSNLLTKYRNPHWSAIRKVRIDRTITWVAHILLQIQEIVMNEAVHAEVRVKAEAAGICFEQVEKILWQAEQTVIEQEFISLPGQAKEDITRCTEMLRQADSLNKTVVQ